VGTALTDQFSHEGRVAPALAIATGLVIVAVALTGGSAEARKLTGSSQGEWMVGTQGADRLNGKGGGDRLKGRGGGDSLMGGKGRDLVVGGKGLDRHRGGPGSDLVKAADGRTDKVVNGGPGVDRCVVDGVAELAIARSCEQVNVAPLADGGGGGPVAGLVIRSVNGLLCDTPLPACAFTIRGDGAEAPIGTVTGGGGVVAVGAGVAFNGAAWTAAGLLGCASDGYIHIVIGAETVDVPVDCSLSL
jgi:hypothetical protein